MCQVRTTEQDEGNKRRQPTMCQVRTTEQDEGNKPTSTNHVSSKNYRTR